MKPVTGRFKRRWGLWITLGLLVVLLGIPTFRLIGDIRQNQRDSALIAAIKKRDAATVKSLLEQGADSNARESQEPPRSLWQHVKELFAPKSKPGQPGLFALSLTEEKFDEKIASLLLSKGAKVDVKDKEGRTPLVFAIDRVSNQFEYGGDDIPPYDRFESYVRLLVESGADVNAVNYLGQTRLDRVAFIGNIKMARLLFERGAKVNQEDHHGITPLMTAIYFGNAEMVRGLLESHADVYRKDSDGRTALSIAQDLEDSLMEKPARSKIIRMLREAGAKK